MGHHLGYPHPIVCSSKDSSCATALLTARPSFIQYGCSFTGGGAKNPAQGTAAFRIPWGIQAVPGAILFMGMFFFPRSPRWLASKDRWEEALQTLAHLHGNGDANHPKVLAEYKEIEEALRFEREEAETSFAALVKPRIIKRVVLGMSIQMWSQLCGMNIMMASTYRLRFQPTQLICTVLHCIHHAGRGYRRRTSDREYPVYYQCCHDPSRHPLPG